MDEVEMSKYITDTFTGVDMAEAEKNSFYFYNPDPNVPPEHMFPFVTLMTNDINDQFSNLDRPSVFRLNIGVSKQTFRSLFGEPELPSDSRGAPIEGEHTYAFDFTALDTLMPHPVYGRMYWVCILNPSAETFATKVQPLLAEAYDTAVGKYERKVAHEKQSASSTS